MPSTSSGKAVILSVDDEANVLKALKRTLRKLDAKVITAGSGEEALAVLDEQRVDVVISDMRMPGMNGAELLSRVRATQPHSSRILLTGYSDPDDTVQAVNEGGISRYIAKPWDDDELRQVVGEAIRVVQLERENEHLKAELKKQNESLEVQVTERTESLEQSNAMLQHAVADLEESYETTVALLANLAALPNPESETSAKKMELAAAISEAAGMDDESRQTLNHAMRLHRIGWKALAPELTTCPIETLSAVDKREFEQHPVFAEALLMGVPKLKGVSTLLRAQHERYDGAGFPDRARTKGIPQGAQILAIARDYYDYQRGRIEDSELSAAEAAERIGEGANTAYDPVLVALFEEVLPKIERVGTAVPEIRVDARALQPDMILSRDLTTPQGALLLTKGAALTEALIANVINLQERSDTTLSVYIRHEEE